MILLDISQILHSNVFVMISQFGTENLDETVFKGMVIRSINKAYRTFSDEYGEMVICQDGNPDFYWRKQIFPHYKASRRRSHEENDIKLDGDIRVY